VLTLNAPEHYASLLSPLPENVEIVEKPDAKAFDVIHLFVGNRADLEPLGPKALRAAKPGAVVWISYPKQASKVATDISRDVGWEVIENAGWRPVTQVSVDDVWSALRWRPR
jgi:hypothetical protein